MRKLLIVLLFFCACSRDDVPKDVLKPQKMQAVLYDVIRADEWVDFAVLQDSTFRKPAKRTALYDSIFTIHKITKEEFRKSFEFYQSRPDLLRTMFDSLQKKVNLPTDTAKKVKPAMAL